MVAILQQPPLAPPWFGESSQPAVNKEAPPIRGWVSTFYRNYKGRRLGPYHVRRWKIGKKIHKEYIKPKNIEKVRAACQTHREIRKAGSEVTQWVANVEGNLSYGERMIRWADQGKLRQVDKDFIARLRA